jgi:hypothetical protein
MAIIVLNDALVRFLGNEASDEFCRLLNNLPFAQRDSVRFPLEIPPSAALRKVLGDEGCKDLLAYMYERYITPPSAPTNS